MQSIVVVDPDAAPTHSELWFDDGNLVLQAENTQFRIHRGIICASSTIFKEMFGLPQLVPGDELVEGCPVIHLSDSAVDVQHVLKAIYDRRHRCHESNLPGLLAFLRLGKKYEISSLHDEAMEVLQKCFPSTLKAFEDAPVLQPIEYVQIINFVLETGTGIFLPAVLSALLIHAPLSEIAGGFSNTCFIQHEGLTMLCLGYHHLRGTALHSFRPSCVTKSACWVAMLRFFMTTERESRIMTLTPLDRLTSLKFCVHCAEDAQKHWNDWRKSVWDQLPSYFGLPPWEELLSSS